MIKTATDLQDSSKLTSKMTEEIELLTDDIIQRNNKDDALLVVQFLLSSMKEGVTARMLPKTPHKYFKKLIDNKVISLNDLNDINYFINSKHTSVCDFLQLSFIKHRNTLKDAFTLESMKEFAYTNPDAAWEFLLKGNKVELFNKEIIKYYYEHFALDKNQNKKNELLCSFTSVKNLLENVTNLDIKTTDIIEPVPTIYNRLLQ